MKNILLISLLTFLIRSSISFSSSRCRNFKLSLSMFLENRLNSKLNFYNFKKSTAMKTFQYLSDINSNIDLKETLKEAALFKSVPNESIKIILNDSNYNDVEKLSPNYNINDIAGKWELVLSTLVGYLPVVEIIDFLNYRLESSYKNVLIARIDGNSEVLSNIKPIEIQFTPTKVTIGWFSINFPSKKPKSYKFLYVDKLFCVAKSSNGGYAILKRVS